MQVTKENFFSMDRLVEFGMGMAMSQQIVQSMNNMMASMQMMPQIQVAAQPLYVQQSLQQGMPMQPVYRQYAGQPAQAADQNPARQGAQPVPPPLPETAAQPVIQATEAYFVSLSSGLAGPYTGAEIVRLVNEKTVTASTPVWKNGMTGWKTAADFPELVALIALVPPPLPLPDSKE